jgi:hypothetical protein
MAFLVAMAVTSCRRTPPDATATEGLRVTGHLSTNMIHVGDPVMLSLEIEHPSDGRLEWSDISRGKTVVSREQKQHAVRLDNQRTRTHIEHAITSFEIGDHIISTGTVRFTRSDGTVIDEPFPFLALTVSSLLTDTNAAPRDIKNLADWPRPSYFWIALVAAGLALLVAAIIAAIWFLRRRNDAALVAAPPPPPHEIALRALRDLLDRRYIEDNRFEIFYVELSAIIRSYLEARFNLRAPEQTTEEFIRDVSISRTLSTEHQALVADFLTQCDLVKFARYAPDTEMMKQAYAAAERLVNETIPVLPSPLGPRPPDQST